MLSEVEGMWSACSRKWKGSGRYPLVNTCWRQAFSRGESGHNWRASSTNLPYLSSPRNHQGDKAAASGAHSQRGTLAAWTKRLLDTKLKFISETAFPCQSGGISPDPEAEEKRLLTFLYHKTVDSIRNPARGPGEREEVEDWSLGSRFTPDAGILA